MKVLRVSLLLLLPVLGYPQDVPKAADKAPQRLSVSDFGFSYPLSSDWVLATELIRKRVESGGSTQDFAVLLAAVYVPKSNLYPDSPFFTLFANRRPGGDCRKSLEDMIAKAQDTKNKTEGEVVQFSAAGRDYFRVNMAHGIGGRHQSTICTVADGHFLIWQTGAPNEKGLNLIVDTLNGITPLPLKSPEVAQSPEQNASETENIPANPVVATPTKVRVASGVVGGLLIKKVAPVYPMGARAAYIQGTVILRAEISKEGDVTDLELLSGPIELAGSAVAAVRQWKYKPYLLNGQPVAVETQLQVNYELR
jgi:TonB family protein